MHKDLIVAIFVPTLRDADAPSSRSSGAIGTGYPVADDLILTARHVLNPPRRNPRAKLRLCWYYAQRPGGSCVSASCWKTIDNDAVVWEGRGDLDAALIRCSRPDVLRGYPYGLLAETKPRSGSRWEGAGFARADRRNGVRAPGDFGGTVRSMADNASFFTVLEDA